MKNKHWRRDPGFYRFSVELPTRYMDVDTERHINNVAVMSLHAEARSRLHLHLFGREVWLAQTGILRSASLATDFLEVTHYPAPVHCGVSLVELDERGYTLAVGMFQEGVCVGTQECRTAAWQQGDWQRLPQHVHARLFGFGLTEEPVPC